MPLPTFIKPDNLKQAIINITFEANLPFELIAGKINDVLIPLGFKYIPSPKPMNLINNKNRIEFGNSGAGFFHNQQIKIQIMDTGGLIFNILNSYVGWENYRKHLLEALTAINSLNIISFYKNIGLRYISEFLNEDLDNKLRSNFLWNIENKDLTPYSSVYKTEYRENKRKIVINLANNLERINNELQAVEKFSIVDIDVICPLKNITDFELLKKEIEDSHLMEKEFFFGLLSKDYLNSIEVSY